MIKGLKSKKKTFTKILFGLFIIFIGIQFIRPEKNNGLADTHKDITHFVQVPDTVRSLLKVSCYDCHSEKTHYPWYAEISPASLWLAKHIKDGKAELNFSDFSQYTPRRMKNKINAIGDQVEKQEMPLKSYLLIHRDAKLTEGQIKLITNWTDSAKAQLDRKR